MRLFYFIAHGDFTLVRAENPEEALSLLSEEVSEKTLQKLQEIMVDGPPEIIVDFN